MAARKLRQASSVNGVSGEDEAGREDGALGKLKEAQQKASQQKASGGVEQHIDQVEAEWTQAKHRVAEPVQERKGDQVRGSESEKRLTLEVVNIL
ncbi:hypothetical protein E2C01_049850 [Portunus trituberculatus]|uniref:Uncharacterized protein n=1 Tax=Portunus trituberculatus TaxID=210409 RepID=A0A5B7GH79_PORTR|nr:hypothetical protein [Portunus trituberculatus]